MSHEAPLSGLHIAIVYDCFFPYTVGGGERWFRLLAEGLSDAGADVTYLTRRQWEEPPNIPGLRVIEVSGRSELYDAQGRRKLAPTLRFGGGVLRWFVRHRREYDVVQLANFPFWSLLALRVSLAGSRTRVVVEWFEIWSRRFWRSYAGLLMGTVGYCVQRLCLALSPEIVVTSLKNAERLVAGGHHREPVVLVGLMPAAPDRDDAEPLVPTEPPFVLYAGRHIRDKGVDLLPETFQLARNAMPELRFAVAGDGPLRSWLKDECDARGLGSVVDILGFVVDDDLDRLISEASCVVVPSRREGYGMMVVDAMGRGTPVVTAAFEENLAVEHIDPGRNGVVACPPTPEQLADGIVAVVAAGRPLRETTIGWYREHASTKTIALAVTQMVTAHSDWAKRASRGVRGPAG
jgi:glycosyltransferase involved in cell wall biosynthesis